MNYKHLLLFFLIGTFSLAAQDLKTPFEKGNGNQSTSYASCIAYYELLAQQFGAVELQTYGTTDVGEPLHLVVIDSDRDFDQKKTLEAGKTILLINNAIHPGEPEGIDASMMLARDLVTVKEQKKLLDNVVVLIVPMYNIGGALNRGGYSRANQNGPEQHGFRGNARNLDLNRDFIKADSKNAFTFAEIFTKWQPHVFIDNHTSNGADYQYTMTYIATQQNKLSPVLSKYLWQTMQPQLEQKMKMKGQEMSPYVYSISGSPDNKGIKAFLETPRYSTGYTTLFNAIGFVPETHMLKPFKDRLDATYKFSESVIEIMNREYKAFVRNKNLADEGVKIQKQFALDWALDTVSTKTLAFKGYKAEYKPSEVSGLQRLYYNRDSAFVKDIPFYYRYNATTKVNKPKAYIVPQAWQEVIDRLKANKVEMTQLQEDTLLNVELYYIDKYETRKQPYEGHYLHYNTTVRTQQGQLEYRKGDYLINLNQSCNRYIIETLEPQGVDSFFNWNFFDSILQQKEYFSPYVFEDVAAEMLAKDPDLKQRLEEAKAADEKLRNSGTAQLFFIYTNSPYYENTHKRYPVGRVID